MDDLSYDGAISLQRAEEHLRQRARESEQRIRYRADGEIENDDQAAPHIRDAAQAQEAAAFIEAHWRSRT